jgi:hypothetical protein
MQMIPDTSISSHFATTASLTDHVQTLVGTPTTNDYQEGAVADISAAGNSPDGTYRVSSAGTYEIGYNILIGPFFGSVGDDADFLQGWVTSANLGAGQQALYSTQPDNEYYGSQTCLRLSAPDSIQIHVYTTLSGQSLAGTAPITSPVKIWLYKYGGLLDQALLTVTNQSVPPVSNANLNPTITFQQGNIALATLSAVQLGSPGIYRIIIVGSFTATANGCAMQFQLSLPTSGYGPFGLTRNLYECGTLTSSTVISIPNANTQVTFSAGNATSSSVPFSAQLSIIRLA